MYTESLAGSSRLALVEGSLGYGKTRVLRTFVDSMTTSDALLLRTSCCGTECDLPLCTVHQILSHVGVNDDRPHRPHAGSGEFLDTFESLSLAVQRLARHTPVVIAVDDVHQADVMSQHCLLHLVRRMQSYSVFMLFTTCPELRSTGWDFAAELGRQPECTTLRLRPFTETEVDQLLAEDRDSAVPRSLGKDLHTSTGGNPLLVHAVIDDHRTEADQRVGAYAEALLSCLRRLGENVQRIARAVAVLGDSTGDALCTDVSQLTGMDPTSVARGLAVLTAIGMLGEGRLRHPGAGPAVLGELSAQAPQENSDLQLAAARLRHEQGAPATGVAAHLVLADRAEPWELDTLIDASEQWLLGGRCELAEDALKLAFKCCTAEQDRAAVQAHLSLAEWRTNIALSARHLSALSDAAGSGKLGMRETVAAVRQLLWHGRTEEATNALALVRTSATERRHESTTTLEDTERWLSVTYPLLAERGRQPDTPQHSAVAPNFDPWLRATGTMSDILLHGHTDAAGQACQVLRDLEITDGSFWAEEAATLALLVLLCTDRVDDAREWCDRLLASATIGRAPTRRAMLVGIAAEIAVRQGDACRARQYGQEALDHMPLRSWGAAVGLPLGALIRANTIMGETSESAKLLSRSVPETMFSSRSGLHYLYARGRYHLATNHPRAALADFLSCGELMRDAGIDIGPLVPWRVGAAEAWLQLSNCDRARSLVYDQLARLRHGAGVRAASLRLLAGTSSASRRLQLLTEAVEAAESAGDNHEHAKALGDLGRAYQASGENRRARLLFRRALHMAKTGGAAPLTRELQSATGEIQEIVPAPREQGLLTRLTGSEQRVASLAVLGYTNREIASRLYVTPSTVEQHLTKVYRKLDVCSRQDLPLELSRRTSQPGRRIDTIPVEGAPW